MLNEKMWPYLAENSDEGAFLKGEIHDAKNVVDIINKLFHADTLPEEHMYMLTMTNKGNPTGVFEIGHGTATCCVVSTKSIYTRALLAGAAAIILIHCHPSGDPSPSPEDYGMTTKAVEAGKLLDVKVLDHIIIGRNGFYSMLQNGAKELQ